MEISHLKTVMAVWKPILQNSLRKEVTWI